MRALPSFVAVLFAGMLCSCQGIEVLERLPAKHGLRRDFEASLEKSIAAARPALKASALAVEKEQQLDSDTFVFYAEAGPFPERQGEVVRLRLTRTGSVIEVGVIAVQKMTSNLHFKSTEVYASEIFTHMEATLRGTAARDRYLPASDPPSKPESKEVP